MLVLAAWLGLCATLHLRANDEHARAVELILADRSLHEVEAARLQGVTGALPPAVARGRALKYWRAVQSAADAAGDAAFAAELRRTGTQLDFGVRDDGRPPKDDATSARLAMVDQGIDAAADRMGDEATRDGRGAWAATVLAGGVAALLILLLLRGYARASRSAERLRTAAARADGERRALADAARRFRALVQHASDAVVVIDRGGRVSFATEAIDGVLGIAPAALTGRKLAELLEPAARRRLAALLDDAATRDVAVGEEVVLRHREGHPVHVDVRVADRRSDPDVDGIVLTLRDVGERRRLERQLHAQAVRDARTGLANRAQFDRWVDAALAGADGGCAVGAIVLDLDDFGTINESLGHAAGDRLLAACAERLRGVVGHSGRLARLGGDEFGLLCDDVRDPASAERTARALLDALCEPVRLDAAEVHLSASAGVALAAAGGGTENLLRAADTALHAAKRRGAAQVEVFTPDMHRQAVRRLELRSALAHAIEHDELTLAYQPIVDITTGRVRAVEALVRWERAGTPVSPADFIPVAEAAGLIVPLGARVLERACAEVAEASADDGARLRVSVNVSAVQLRTPGFAAEVACVLDRSGLPAEALVLELTESAMVEDVAGAQAVLGAVRALGVGIAVDDFGTGWSSLAALADLPLDVLKLDRSFVAAMDASPAHGALIAGVVSMADRLGLYTVIEGVETAEQLDRLRALGGHYAQGYHLGRPGPLAAATRSAATARI